ncbi:MAG: HAMP domain-containing histidine kinase [Deltaproteobacteria bacterium]|nr:HAMP domain-containing histidine kinase [Deltaproteobacteria bacterium]
MILAIAITLMLWLRRRVIRPWFALADTVRRFGEGERTARAEENGPLELQDMSKRFNTMADSIASQREAQVAFLGGVAHDLRTPLSALALAVDMLGPDDPLPPEPQLRRTLAVIARQIHHLERMVGDFVDMSTIDTGKLALDVDYHDVRMIVRDAVGLFSHTDAGAERLRVALPRNPCLALCDDVRIGQVVTNLVSNAIKYSPATEPIAVAVDTDESDVIVEVTDRGTGISREDHRRIFEPFRRVGSRTAAAGTGLGLFNVQRIVEAHGGRIEVESVPSEGSTFRIYLRLARASATASVAASHARS